MGQTWCALSHLILTVTRLAMSFPIFLSWKLRLDQIRELAQKKTSTECESLGLAGCIPIFDPITQLRQCRPREVEWTDYWGSSLSQVSDPGSVLRGASLTGESTRARAPCSAWVVRRATPGVPFTKTPV